MKCKHLSILTDNHVKMFTSPFSLNQVSIPSETQVVFVADMFVEDYIGGAELTSQSIIDSSPLNLFKINSKDVNMKLLEQGAGLIWIFGNFSQLDFNLIPTIVANLKYVILEYDYKYCSFRSPEKHFTETSTPCDCHNTQHGKFISAFYHGARALFWMSEAQKDKYCTLFPFLLEKDNIILSSVFDATSLLKMKTLRESTPSRKGWLVLGSPSWVKGYEDAVQHCIDNSLEYEVVWNLPYEKLLEKLATSEGFVYLPRGADTCPRMVIEAKLLGCKLVLNDYVQHHKENWFATDDVNEIEQYLYAAPKVFWSAVKTAIEHRPTISGYTTVYNASSQGYPFIQCIKSMLQFCDEVCIVDGGSTDDTINQIKQLVDPRIVLKIISRDWSGSQSAVYDGMQKAEARNLCTKEFCWQMDCDEIVHEDHSQKIIELASVIAPGINLVALPVIEYWGSTEKVRIDVNLWKWRLSRNNPQITHGIPSDLRRVDENGNIIAIAGDGCDYIDKEQGLRIPFIGFWNNDLEKVRQQALRGDVHSLLNLQTTLNSIVENVPSVFHYSWVDIARKIRLYRDYWTRHWVELAGQKYVDTAENNMFFDVPWSEVTEDMIVVKAAMLATQTGGHIFHTKWDGKQTPSVTIKHSQPRVMY